jgi:hypothetical protein
VGCIGKVEGSIALAVAEVCKVLVWELVYYRLVVWGYNQMNVDGMVAGCKALHRKHHLKKI